MKWIKHDTDANQDAKLQNLLLDYGLEGYGLYWYCIELIAGKVDVNNITFELEHDARIIARNTGSTAQRVEEMMKYFVKIGLFECSNNTITCLKLAKRLDQSMTSNPVMREIIKNFKEVQGHDSVMISHDDIMQDKTSIDQISLDKTYTSAVANCPHDSIIEIYHKRLPRNPRVKIWTDKRKALLKQRWREDPKRQSLEWWDRFFGYVSESQFLTGMVDSGNRPFLADLEWIVKPSNFVKIIEGKYQ